MYSLIKSATMNIIHEARENEMISRIVQALTQMGEIEANDGDNQVTVDIDEGIYAVIDYTVDDYRYYSEGHPGDGYITPPDPYEMNGKYKIYILNVEVFYEDDGYSLQVEDNGMIESALNDLVVPDDEHLEVR